MEEPFIDKITSLLGSFLDSHGYKCTAIRGDQMGGFGCGAVYETEFIAIVITRDRGQESISIGSKVRLRSRADLHPWQLGHLLAYLDGSPDSYAAISLETEATLLQQRADEILDLELLGSKQLSDWATQASRRMFGHGP